MSLRKILWPISLAYGSVMGLRNWSYDRGWFTSQALSAPVISIGNLTVGGTGKTPAVLWLVGLAREQGRNPGVLARGYQRARGEKLNDEGKLIARRYADLPQVQCRDRIVGGRELCAQHDVDLVILDDGFQHRRLKRDLDILCMDARAPFAQGTVLPAGDLRENRCGLSRADLVLLTRAEGLDQEQVGAQRRSLQEIAGKEFGVFPCEHRPSALRSMPDGVALDLKSLQGRRVLLLSSIARPRSFRNTAKALGAEVVGEVIRRDHHNHSREEFQQVHAAACSQRAEVLTTEKDAVKLLGMPEPHLVIEIDLYFPEGAPGPEVLGLS